MLASAACWLVPALALAAETTVSVSLGDLPSERVLVELRDGVADEVTVQAAEFVIGRAGTGLGLSTSFGIVQGHGGTLTVESEPGRGTVFRLRLPIDADEAADS